MESIVLTIETGRHAQVVDVTTAATDFCRGRGDGLLSAFVPHATAGLAIMETGAGSDDDLLASLNDLLPRDDRWRHRHGSKGHGADHVLPAIIAPSITIPVIAGSPTLGTWQSLVLVDPNTDNPTRNLRLSFLPSPQ